ncbi:MAG: hypothetical protein R3C19_26355 [Planctomycetaceae bacterium]
MKHHYRVDRPTAVPGDSVESVPQSAAGEVSPPAATRRRRFDGPEPIADITDTASGRTRTRGLPHQWYIDERHDSRGIRGPHYQVTVPKRSNFTSMTGQFLAYLGVLGLTVGTAMVIYGHFGGYSDYTPTGWLVTTAAQMLLFLGVINLVSGGIEQNNDDVSQRINSLGDQLMRIQEVNEQLLRGPKISARRYADPNAPLEESERESVMADERVR